MDKKTREKISKEQAAKYGADFISYLESGASAALFIVRDIVNSIKTGGKWIDVLETDGEKNSADRWDFKSIRVEIFPRKTQPDYVIYPENATEYQKIAIDVQNHYLTWKTAHEDIAILRAAGYAGPKFEVCPKLIDKNAGNVDIFVELWNPKSRQIQLIDSISRDGKISNVPAGYTIREKSRQPTAEHDWDYQILSVKRLDETPPKSKKLPKTSPHKPASQSKKSPVKLIVTSSEKC